MKQQKSIHRVTGGLLISCCLALLCTEAAFAQSRNTHRCEVGVIDISSRRAREQDKFPVKVIGRFETVIGEEELSTRFYSLPGTRLFLIPSVFYTDEYVGTDDSADSASLRLEISRKAKRAPFSSLQYATAEVMLNNFDVAQVTTTYKSGKRAYLILMECRYQGSKKT